MNAYHLMKPDGSRSGYTACEMCDRIALESNIDISESCCICRECKQPIPMDEKFAINTLYHRACEKIRDERGLREALEKAELVADYDGPVYFEGGSGSFGNGYYANPDELAMVFNPPEFAFCCEEIPFGGIDLDNVLDNLTEEMFEDARDHLNGVDELQTAVDAFNEANKGLMSWYEDRKRKARIIPSGNDPSPLT